MKNYKLPFFLFLILISVSGVWAVGTYPNVDPNMVLYYHFNNGTGENSTFIKDFSNFGNNGTAFNITYNISNSLLQDGAIDLNGNSSYVNTSYNGLIANGTISILVKFNSVAVKQQLIQKGSGSRPAIYVNPNKVTVDFYNGTGYNSLNSNTILYANNWYNIVVTWGSNGLRLYINGLLDINNSRTDTYQSVTSNFTLGRSGDNDKEYLNGSLDEFILYNKSLNDSEILNNYKLYSSCGNIPYKGCNFFESTVIDTGNYNCSGNYFNNPYSVVDSCYPILFDNITIDGNNSNVYYASSYQSITYAFFLANLRNITLKNFNLIQSYNGSNNINKAIFLYNTTNSNILSNNITTYCHDSCNGIASINSSNNIYNNNILTANGNYSDAMHFNNDNNSKVINNIINIYGQYSTNGIYFGPAIGNIYFGSSNGIINNNIVSTYGTSPYNYGIQIEDHASNFTVYNNTVNGNGGSQASYSFLLDFEYFCHDFNVSRNTLISSNRKGYGIAMDLGIYNFIVDNNYIWTNGTWAHGINIVDEYKVGTNLTGHNNSITNNEVYVNDGTSNALHLLNVYNNTFYNNYLYSKDFPSVGLYGSNGNWFIENDYDTNTYSVYNNYSGFSPPFGFDAFFGNFTNSSSNNNFILNGNVFSFFNLLNTSKQNIYNLSSSLILLSNNSIVGSSDISLNNGDFNITLLPNQSVTVYTNVSALPLLVNYNLSYNTQEQNNYSLATNQIQNSVVGTVINFFSLTPVIGTILGVVILILAIVTLVIYIKSFNNSESPDSIYP